MSSLYSNLLINESSPYLLQHAHNPVNWMPWCDMALSMAKQQNKPILVSIGYAACHWCHVMERESFEDESVAEIMNTYFVNIKIDREERPDLDSIYMEALQILTGSGGWPLNVFLTPSLKPFFGGTYFPPVEVNGRMPWKSVLKSIADAWEQRREDIENQAHNLVTYMKGNIFRGLTKKFVNQEAHADNTLFQNLMKDADHEWGGFGNPPKFPQFACIQLLFQSYYFTKNNEALKHALISIDKILQGGIYDHISGGIARYSTDKEWLAPHFEKMLYDNALMIDLLCDAYSLTGNEEYAEAIHHSIAFIQEEMVQEEGGFYAAMDADSEGIEGKYYVWDKTEIDQLLEENADLFCRYYNITNDGNWEHKNILRVLVPIKEFARLNGLPESVCKQRIKQGIRVLREKRSQRIKPGVDTKIILSWNAMMTGALARAAVVLQSEEYMQLSTKHYNYIKAKFRKQEESAEMFHVCTSGELKGVAFLDDYVYFIRMDLQLYELTFNEKYLTEAKEILEYTIKRYSDNQSNMFFYTREGQPDILIRKADIYDGAIPSANAVMADMLRRVGLVFSRKDFQERSGKMIQSMAGLSLQYPASFAYWACLLQQYLNGTDEITIIASEYRQWGMHAAGIYSPGKILVAASKKDNKIKYINDKFTGKMDQIYLCRGNVCLPPFDSFSIFYKVFKKIPEE